MKLSKNIFIFVFILLVSLSSVHSAPVTDVIGTLTLSGATVQTFAERFVPRYNVTLLSFNSTSGSNCQVGRLFNGSHVQLTSVAVNGTNQFNIVYNLTAGQIYYVGCNNTAGTYTAFYDNCAFPILRTNVNFTGSYDSSAGDDTTYCRGITSVTTQNTSDFYPSPTVSFNPSTDVNNTFRVGTNYLYISINTTNMLSSNNVYGYVYNSSGSLYGTIYPQNITCVGCQKFHGSSDGQYVANITVIGNGLYFFNATAIYNSTMNVYTETRKIYLNVAQLNITAYNGSSPISNFTTIITDLNTGDIFTNITTNGLSQFDGQVIYNHNYSIFVNASGMAYSSQNKTISQLYNSANFSLDLFNTIKVYSFLESSSSPININASLNFVGVSNSFTKTMNGTNANFSFLPDDTYTISVSSSSFINNITTNYSNRQYVVSVTNSSSQVLNMFLLPSASSSTIGIYIKSLNDNILSGASVSVQKLINTSYVSVAEGLTDGTGFVTFGLQEGSIYRLVISASNYDVYYADFVPYLANSPYTFKLSPSGGFTFTTLGDYINYAYSPLYSNLNTSNQTFTFTTYSLNGSIIYNYISCNGITQNVSGSPTGSTLSVNLNLTPNTLIDCEYGFDLVETGFYNFHNYYKVYSPYPNSWEGSADKIKSVTDSIWLTLVSYVIILIIALGIRRFYPDPRLIGVVICIGIIFFVSIGWVDKIAGGVSATIGLLILYASSR